MTRKFFSQENKRGLFAGLFLFSFVFLTAALPFAAYAQSANGSSGGSSDNNAGASSAAGGVAGCTVSLLGNLPIFASAAITQGAVTMGSTNMLAVQSTDVASQISTGATGVSSNLNLGVNLSNLFRDDFLNCITRALARAALQQMAVSTINWINSGFEGSPSFIQNYNQFFTNVADDVAGQFIQGSDLAFLCSPFQADIRIALAQSYAANSYSSQSCTLSDVTNNINGFMGNFDQGGWPAFLSFTTSPTNNPYGAYMYAQSGLQTSINNAQQTNAFDLQLGQGFLSATQEQNCKTSDTPPTAGPGQKVTQHSGTRGASYYTVCDIVNVTPGTAIAQSLDKALGSGPDSLVNAKYFDEIISALISQLIQKTLYGGLSGLSNGGQGYGDGTNGMLDSLVQVVMQNIGPYQDAARKVISINNQNIADFDNSIGQAQTVKQCWQTKLAAVNALATTTPQSSLSASEQAALQAAQAELQGNIQSIQSVIDSLTSQKSPYLSSTAAASSSIDELNYISNQLSQATDQSTISSIVTMFQTSATNGDFFSDSNYTNSQEDRLYLTASIARTNQDTATVLSQCNAYQLPTITP